MLKKLLALFLSLSMLFSLFSFASSAYEITPSEESTQVGYLYDESGNVQVVYGELVSGAAPASISGDELQVTYKYSLAATDYSLIANPTGYGIDVYLTLNYKQQGNPAEVLLTSIEGEWEITDSRCSVTSSNLHYGCNGGVVTTQNGYRSVSNGFTRNTGFTRYVPKVDDPVVGSIVGAYICFDLLMGTSRRYTFVASNHLCGGLADDFECPDC